MSEKRELRSCIACIHFGVCKKLSFQGRKVLISGGDPLIAVADECDDWIDVGGTGLPRHDIVKKMVDMLRRGEIVVINTDGGQVVRLIGGYADAEDAKSAANGQPCILFARL